MGTHFHVLTLSLLIFLSVRSFAAISEADCKSAKDVSSEFGAVRDQKQANWCWSYATADLMSAFQGLKDKDAISAKDVSVRALSATPADIIAVASKLGGRSLKIFAAYNAQHPVELNDQSLDMQTQGMREAILAYQENPQGICSEKQLASQNYENTEDAFFIKHQIKALREKFEALRACPNRDPVASLAGSFNQAFAKYVKDEDDKICQPRGPVKPMSPVFDFFDPSKPKSPTAAENILNTLKANRPVGITYDASFYEYGLDTPPTPPDHHSTVIATRWSGTKCEFKIRNTWGPDCTKYRSSGLDAACENGNIWVNEDVLDSRVYNTVYIK